MFGSKANQRISYHLTKYLHDILVEAGVELYRLKIMADVKLPDTIEEAISEARKTNRFIIDPIPEAEFDLTQEQDDELWRQLLSIDNLTHLNVQNFGLSGSIPVEIGNLENLVELVVSGNKNLSGNLPDTISDCSKLRLVVLNNTRVQVTETLKNALGARLMATHTQAGVTYAQPLTPQPEHRTVQI